MKTSSSETAQTFFLFPDLEKQLDPRVGLTAMVEHFDGGIELLNFGLNQPETQRTEILEEPHVDQVNNEIEFLEFGVPEKSDELTGLAPPCSQMHI